MWPYGVWKQKEIEKTFKLCRQSHVCVFVLVIPSNDDQNAIKHYATPQRRGSTRTKKKMWNLFKYIQREVINEQSKYHRKTISSCFGCIWGDASSIYRTPHNIKQELAYFCFFTDWYSLAFHAFQNHAYELIQCMYEESGPNVAWLVWIPRAFHECNWKNEKWLWFRWNRAEN